jgi:hypothetical protein
VGHEETVLRVFLPRPLWFFASALARVELKGGVCFVARVLQAVSDASLLGRWDERGVQDFLASELGLELYVTGGNRMCIGIMS